MLLYHFEGSKHGLENLTSRRFKVSTFEDVNDPYELLGVRLRDPVQRLGLRLQRRQIGQQLGMICMTSRWSNPMMWSHYGDKHLGMALQFRVQDEIPVEVTYASRMLEPFAGSLPEDAVAHGKHLLQVMSHKYSSWRYEREWRLPVPLAHCAKEGKRWFLPYPAEALLTSVILGPRCRFTDEEVRAALGGDADIVPVVRSRLAFNAYRVVLNREATSAETRRVFRSIGA